MELPKTAEPEQKTSAMGAEEDLCTDEGHQKTSVQWNILKINAPKVWAMDERGRGKGVLYANADTGVSFKHPVLVKNYNGLMPDGRFDHNYSWYDGVRRKISVGPPSKCGIASPEPCDDQGHGTHVMSTSVGSDGYGVAPDARWIACKNMDNGVGSPETYLNCLNFFLAPHDLDGQNPDPSRRPHVVGNSYGCPDSEGCSPHAMTNAMEALRAAGIFMSVSAGNNGPDCGTITDPPAIEPLGFSVGAVDRNDKVAPFSSRGPVSLDGKTYIKPDICAPGVDIMGAIGANGFKKMSGTSMASPHVSGLAVLMSMPLLFILFLTLSSCNVPLYREKCGADRVLYGDDSCSKSGRKALWPRSTELRPQLLIWLGPYRCRCGHSCLQRILPYSRLVVDLMSVHKPMHINAILLLFTRIRLLIGRANRYPWSQSCLSTCFVLASVRTFHHHSAIHQLPGQGF